MTRIQKIQSIIMAVLMIVFAGLILIYPEFGYPIISLLLIVTLTAAGIRELVYYLTMAKHMVSGKTVLYRAMILCDLALFTNSLRSLPRTYLLVYLAVLFGFSGLVDVLGGLETRRMGGGKWKMQMFIGLVGVFAAFAIVLFHRDGRMAEILYAFSLINSAVLRIISAFRQTGIVYIS